MKLISETIKIESQGNVVKYFKENSLMFNKLYLNPKDGVRLINISNIKPGKFYFFYNYLDESNWMRFSPILFIDSKKHKNDLIGYAINFNFIPIEIRAIIFDYYIKDLNDNTQLSNITFKEAYLALLKVGYEYALVEYDIKRLNYVFEIDISLLPKFLYSTFPKNKYDPKKLYDIWVKKLETKEERHQEIIQMTLNDLLEIKDDINEQFNMLSNHIKRLQRNSKKYKR